MSKEKFVYLKKLDEYKSIIKNSLVTNEGLGVMSSSFFHNKHNNIKIIYSIYFRYGKVSEYIVWRIQHDKNTIDIDELKNRHPKDVTDEEVSLLLLRYSKI